MVGLAALFTVLIGLPTGVLLFISRANGLAPMPKLNALLGAVINIGRSLPFIVLLIALIPFTRLIVGTTLGSTAAIVPVTIGAFPFFARLTENALDEVDYGRIEAILSMGGNVWHVIFKSHRKILHQEINSVSSRLFLLHGMQQMLSDMTLMAKAG